jgi:hypothetical protein
MVHAGCATWHGKGRSAHYTECLGCNGSFGEYFPSGGSNSRLAISTQP